MKDIQLMLKDNHLNLSIKYYKNNEIKKILCSVDSFSIKNTCYYFSEDKLHPGKGFIYYYDCPTLSLYINNKIFHDFLSDIKINNIIFFDFTEKKHVNYSEHYVHISYLKKMHYLGIVDSKNITDQENYFKYTYLKLKLDKLICLPKQKNKNFYKLYDPNKIYNFFHNIQRMTVFKPDRLIHIMNSWKYQNRYKFDL